MKDYVAEFNKKIAEIDEDTKNVYIINAGIMNHGKSSLFNSLLDSNVFATEDRRTTVVNEKAKWTDNVYLIDTPGLEAEKSDDKMAYEAYRNANCIVFVHTTKVGELHKKELDAINKIKSLFDNEDFFWQHFCLVFTFLDSDSVESVESIKAKSLEDLKNSCGAHEFKTFTVSNSRYQKGRDENKQTLMKKSGIPELRAYMKESLGSWFDENKAVVRGIRIGRAKAEILSQLEEEISKIKSESENKIQQLKNSQKNFLYRVEETVNQYLSDESNIEYEEDLLGDMNADYVRLFQRWNNERY